MFNIILFNPEIPPNTGNIIRLSANTGINLHLIKPLGFKIDDTTLKRAGLDYQKDAKFFIHDDFDSCIKSIEFKNIYALTKFAKKSYSEIKFTKSDCFLFGNETSGLPENILKKININNQLRIPMISGSRSLNLSNSVAITIYEALRQNSFNNLV
ncbi:tRNA (cytidine(34)-2'-O)-methyltransferase [Alphaproteobacteria bacterium]|nr:tRNA (cytidine(34)-2'-O)-methyltransferase [Alphaproteobacteria bacterium]